MTWIKTDGAPRRIILSRNARAVRPKQMKKIVTALVVLSLAAYGCAGRTPNPVSAYELGDDRKSCEALKVQIDNVHEAMLSKLLDADKSGKKNTALGVAGAILIVPLFFMDLSKADQVESEALRRRYNNLVILAREKQCGFDYKPVHDFQELETESSS